MGPFAQHQGGERIVPRVAPGLGYVALGSSEETLALLGSLATAHRTVLWITDRAREDLGEDAHVLRVTTLGDLEGGVDPKRLGDLRDAVIAFVSRDASGLVILDCMEYLVLHNGADRVLRALADLHDVVTMNGGSLVVFVDVHLANPRLVAWLERELDALPVDAVASGEIDGLSA